MFPTAITARFGLSTPILNAGMAMVAGPELAAAVSNAGGLGMLGGAMVPPEGLRAMIAATRALTPRAFGVDLIGDFIEPEHVAVLIEERVALTVFFWTIPPAAEIARLTGAGLDVWAQVGSVAEASDAVAKGVTGLVVQGSEAGGHTRAEATTMTLFPRIRTLFPELPLACAGGIADGATMAAALTLGADAVWCGSRFLASAEANAHAAYQRKVTEACVGDTELTSLYGPEWPDQPMRVIRTPVYDLARGREAAVTRLVCEQGFVAGTVTLGGARVTMPRYSAILPMRDFEGDIDQCCLTAGQGAGNIAAVLPAARIVQEMTEGASAALARIVPAGRAA
jgi:NAD(P)H-dependent flavin oxidoreductase YrpB (nitropropane dioxygenase family)